MTSTRDDLDNTLPTQRFPCFQISRLYPHSTSLLTCLFTILHIGTSCVIFRNAENLVRYSNNISTMPGLLALEDHLVFYRKYHMNETNVAIHLGCIPLILLSFITLLSTKAIAGPAYPYLTAGSAVAWIYGIYYVALDWQLGLPSFAVLTSFAYGIRTLYLGLEPTGVINSSNFFSIALGIHIVCWLAQFYGHAFHEKRAPALMDNLLQAVVLAPFFVVFEIAFFLGYKQDTKKVMNNKAGKAVQQMNAAAKVARD